MRIKKKNSIIIFILLHVVLAIYSLGGICSKTAATQKFLSTGFILCYGIMIALLGIYAIAWQQIIKRVPLTTAYANKAVTVIWGLVWGCIFFEEKVTTLRAAGIVLIVSGIIIYALCDDTIEKETDMINLEGNDKRLESIEEIKKLGLPIYMWGGYVYGKVLTEYLREHGINDEITYVVDDEYKKPDDGFMALSEYLEKYSANSVIIFGFYNYEIIQKKKAEYASKIKHMYEFHMTSLDSRRLKWDMEEAKSRLDKFNITYNLLSDDMSRKTMELYLRAAVNGEFSELYDNCHTPIAYFNDVTKNMKIDTLVDCGAFDGDSIHDFVNVFDSYKRIYAIEPDPANREALAKRVERENIHDVITVPKGVYSETTVLHFSSDGTSASHMDDKGDISVPVIALDELLGDCDDNILIKMDIEGSEMDALKGAAETIKKKHPCLTICVYHKETDMILIPQYIHSLVGDGVYDYYIRYHGTDLAELSFYALPRK